MVTNVCIKFALLKMLDGSASTTREFIAIRNLSMQETEFRGKVQGQKSSVLNGQGQINSYESGSDSSSKALAQHVQSIRGGLRETSRWPRNLFQEQVT